MVHIARKPVSRRQAERVIGGGEGGLPCLGMIRPVAFGVAKETDEDKLRRDALFAQPPQMRQPVGVLVEHL